MRFSTFLANVLQNPCAKHLLVGTCLALHLPHFLLFLFVYEAKSSISFRCICQYFRPTVFWHVPPILPTVSLFLSTVNRLHDLPCLYSWACSDIIIFSSLCFSHQYLPVHSSIRYRCKTSCYTIGEIR